MTKEQVESENKNPFVRKTLFGLIKLFVGVIAIALLVFIIRYFDYHTRKLYIALACIFPIFISLMARSIAENAMNISAFKEAKKRISESNGIIEETYENPDTAPELPVENKGEIIDEETLSLIKDVKDEVTRAYLIDEVGKRVKNRIAYSLCIGLLIAGLAVLLVFINPFFGSAPFCALCYFPDGKYCGCNKRITIHMKSVLELYRYMGEKT